MLKILASSILFLSASVLASDQVATLTQIQGDVEIFSHPGKKPTGPSPHVLFEGTYYSVAKAAIGSGVENGNIVRTATGATARLVYENGDLITVGSASAYKVEWQGAKRGTSTFNLLYGKMRFVINKLGPRKGMEVKTADVAMGVRGTEFFVSHKAEKGTDLFVLRGEVSARTGRVTKSVTESQTVRVLPDTKEIQSRQATKPDLEAIEKATHVKEAPAPEPVRARVDLLEQKAKANLLAEVRQANPDLHKDLQANPSASLSEVSAVALASLSEKAPAAEKSSIIEVSDKKEEQKIADSSDGEKKADSSSPLQDDETKFKSKVERWYLLVGAGPQIPGGGGALDLGIYLPRFNSHSIIGGGVNTGQVTADPRVGHIIYHVSGIRFFGTNAGHGWFARLSLGLASITKNSDKSGAPGGGAIAGGGYAWPVFRGTRLLFSANVIVKVSGHYMGAAVAPTVSVMF